MWRKKHTLFGLVIFTVIVFVLSGCGGGGSKGGNGGGGDFKGDFTDFLGTWVSKDLTPQVKLIVSSAIGDVQQDEFSGGYFQYFTGSVQCDGLIGTVAITEDDDSIYGNYIVANFFNVEGVEGSYLVVSVSVDSKSIDFVGSLTSADTMLVAFSDDNLDDFGLGVDELITFKKQ